MNKQEYINLKKSNPMEIIYKFYVENFDSKKHNPFLSPNELFPYLQMQYNLDDIYLSVTKHYDTEFNVMTIMDHKGNIINYC